jgi:hypothetical protein
VLSAACGGGRVGVGLRVGEGGQERDKDVRVSALYS